MSSTRKPVNLPKQIALFPLSGVMLLPSGHVPLSVFEPRYINLVDHALSTTRTFGLIQPLVPQADPLPDDAALYSIGTAGRIVQFADMSDGRYHITLEGLARFRVLAETPFDPTRGYRQVDVEYALQTSDLDTPVQNAHKQRERILHVMQNYFASQDIEADWEAVAEAPYETLVSSLAMTCPFEAGEKQALLECNTHDERARMLISLFEMSGDGGLSAGALKH